MRRIYRAVICSWMLLGMASAQEIPRSIVGKGWGIDDFLIAASSFEQAKETFGTRLGFTVRPSSNFPATGQANAIIAFEPAYLEITWFYERPKTPTGSRMERALDAGGGPYRYNIDVSPMASAANVFRDLSIKFSLPPSRPRRLPDGTEEPGPWQMLVVDPGQAGMMPHVPGSAEVVIFEYTDNDDPAAMRHLRERLDKNALPDPRRLPGEYHANTARRLASFWVAVDSADAAVKQSERLGLMRIGELHSDELGSRGVAVQCGVGTIVFWEPTNKSGVLAGILSKRGSGPFGISLEVGSLERAHALVEKGLPMKLPIVREGSHTSFVVPGPMALNTWIEFVQQ